MILLKNATIIDMVSDQPFNAHILIKGDLIHRIIKEDEQSIEGLSQTIDLKGMTLIPGIIEAHSHLGLAESGIGFEGDDVNEAANPATPDMMGIDGINPFDITFKEAREEGVVLAAVGPGSANPIGGVYSVIKTQGQIIDEMIVKRYGALKIAFGENPKRVYNGKNVTPMTRMGVAAVIREQFYKAKDYIRKQDLGKEDISKAPDYDPKMEILAKVLRREMPIKAHAHSAYDMFTAIRIAKEFDLDMTLDHASDGHLIVDHLVAEGYPCIVGPTFGHRTKYETRNKTFYTPSVLQGAGLLVAITSDSPVIPICHLRLYAGLAANAGMTQIDALKAITINPAKILGIDSEYGTIEEGKKASLALYSGSPLDLRTKCLLTLIDGEVVHRKDV